MSNRIAFLALAALLSFTYSGHGQEMTEKYIPVGAYPELSGKYTSTGTIVSVDERVRAFTLKGDRGNQHFEVTDDTRIWLDKSLLKQTNADGALSDLEVGLKAEVAVFGPARMHIAKWVKVQIPASH